jgi:hypothetical protein
MRSKALRQPHGSDFWVWDGPEANGTDGRTEDGWILFMEKSKVDDASEDSLSRDRSVDLEPAAHFEQPEGI